MRLREIVTGQCGEKDPGGPFLEIELTGGSEPLQKESRKAYKAGVLLSQPEDGRTPVGRPRGHGVGRQASGESLGCCHC